MLTHSFIRVPNATCRPDDESHTNEVMTATRSLFSSVTFAIAKYANIPPCSILVSLAADCSAGKEPLQLSYGLIVPVCILAIHYGIKSPISTSYVTNVIGVIRKYVKPMLKNEASSMYCHTSHCKACYRIYRM
jgi:hypothetical protein